MYRQICCDKLLTWSNAVRTTTLVLCTDAVDHRIPFGRFDPAPADFSALPESDKCCVRNFDGYSLSSRRSASPLQALVHKVVAL